MTENEITNLKFGKWIVLFLVIPALIALFFIGLVLEIIHAATESMGEVLGDAQKLMLEIIKSFNAVKTDGRSGNNLPD